MLFDFSEGLISYLKRSAETFHQQSKIQMEIKRTHKHYFSLKTENLGEPGTDFLISSFFVHPGETSKGSFLNYQTT